MNLISNWQEVLQKAWSVKFGILAAFFGAMEAFFLAMDDKTLGMPPGMFAALAAASSVGGVFARVLDQSKVTAPDDDTILPRI